MSQNSNGHSKTLAVASDHAGFELKSELIDFLLAKGCDVRDLGPNFADSVDYPDYGYALAHMVASGAVTIGVAICGSGIGISIAANRHPKIRAALCHNVETAQLARMHNDANVLALGARVVTSGLAKDMLTVFLATPFAGGRHVGRVEKLENVFM